MSGMKEEDLDAILSELDNMLLGNKTSGDRRTSDTSSRTSSNPSSPKAPTRNFSAKPPVPPKRIPASTYPVSDEATVYANVDSVYDWPSDMDPPLQRRDELDTSTVSALRGKFESSREVVGQSKSQWKSTNPVVSSREVYAVQPSLDVYDIVGRRSSEEEDDVYFNTPAGSRVNKQSSSSPAQISVDSMNEVYDMVTEHTYDQYGPIRVSLEASPSPPTARRAAPVRPPMVGGIQVLPNLSKSMPSKGTPGTRESLSSPELSPETPSRSKGHRPGRPLPPSHLAQEDTASLSAPATPSNRRIHQNMATPTPSPLTRSASYTPAAMPTDSWRSDEGCSNEIYDLVENKDSDGLDYDEVIPPATSIRHAASERRPDYQAGIKTVKQKQEFLRQTSRQMSIDTSTKKVIVNFYNPDDSYKTMIVEEKMLARDVVEALIMKNHVRRGLSWVLVECLTDEKLERDIEDHENILTIYEKWPMEKNFKFIFRENFKKYEVFQNPAVYLPGYRLTEESSTKSADKAQQAKEKLMTEMFMDSDRVTEISGHLWFKEPNRKWKQMFCFLRRSGLYFSTRGACKDPKYWYILIEFGAVNMYTCYDPVEMKKTYNSPTPELLVFKKMNMDDSPKERICICPLDRTKRLCWQQAIRLTKYGVPELRRSYQIALKRHEKLKRLRSAEDVPVHIESRMAEDSSLQSQPWFHGELPKEAAAQIITKHGKQDGSFLVGVFDRTMFLTIRCGAKVNHITIQKIPLAGKMFFTVDGGLHNFPDVKELIDYHVSNQGALPAQLSLPVEKSCD